jgi:hypothetical protein
MILVFPIALGIAAVILWRSRAPGSAGESVSCGGLDPHPWLYTGLVIAALAALAYALARRIGEKR